MKKLILTFLSMFMLVGCSTKRDMTFKTDSVRFENGRRSQIIEVEGSDIQEFLPSIGKELEPYFIGWMDDAGNLVDTSNISTKIETLSVKWDETSLSKHLREKEIKEAVSVFNQSALESNTSEEFDYEFTWEVIDGVDYIVINTILLDQEMIRLLSIKRVRDQAKDQLIKLYELIEQRDEEFKDIYNGKFPIVTRFSLDNSEKTVIYESIEGNVIVDILKS